MIELADRFGDQVWAAVLGVTDPEQIRAVVRNISVLAAFRAGDATAPTALDRRLIAMVVDQHQLTSTLAPWYRTWTEQSSG